MLICIYMHYCCIVFLTLNCIAVIRITVGNAIGVFFLHILILSIVYGIGNILSCHLQDSSK